MKHFLVVLVWTAAVLAQTLADDQAAVQAILDANELSAVSVAAVSTVTGDRITALTLFGGGPRKNLTVPLTVIPGDIGDLSALATLEIGQNDITALPAEIGDLTSLTTLKITWNKKLTTIPDEIGSLAKLTNLDLQANALTALPATIGSLVALEVLRVESNALTTLPDGIGSLAALRQCYAFSNALTTLPSSMVNLSALTTLSVGNNKLCDVTDEALIAWLDDNFSTWMKGQYCAPPEDVAAVEAILAANNVTDLGVQSITSTANGRISDLRLSGKGLTTLPADVGVLTGLTSISLTNNELTVLPAEITLCTELTNIALKNNFLTSLPDGLLLLPNLENLGVDSNMLCGLSEDVNVQIDSLDDTRGTTWRETQVCPISEGDSTAVQAFLDACGLIGKSPASVANTTLDRVTGLDMEKLMITDLVIPPEVAALTELRELRLMDNAITSIPSEIDRFTMVTFIALDRNPNTKPLPSSIGSLTQLKTLYIKGLGLTDLPAEIVNLTNLETIVVDSNQLCDLSEPIETWLTGIDSTWADHIDCSGAVHFSAQLRPGAAAVTVSTGERGWTVMLSLPEKTPVSFEAYTLTGKRVAVVNPSVLEPGAHSFALNARRPLAAGTYQIVCTIGSSRISRTVAVDR